MLQPPIRFLSQSEILWEQYIIYFSYVRISVIFYLPFAISLAGTFVWGIQSLILKTCFPVTFHPDLLRADMPKAGMLICDRPLRDNWLISTIISYCSIFQLVFKKDDYSSPLAEVFKRYWQELYKENLHLTSFKINYNVPNVTIQAFIHLTEETSCEKHILWTKRSNGFLGSGKTCFYSQAPWR